VDLLLEKSCTGPIDNCNGFDWLPM